MIYSNMKEGGRYAFDDKIALCLEHAASLNEATPCGRYELSESVYVNVMSYSPKPVTTAEAESHLIYADLQLVLDGAEFMGCPDALSVTPLHDYDAVKDIAVWKVGQQALLPLRKGDWAMFFPGELHAPSLKMQEGEVKKAVFKIRYDGKI